MSKLRKTLVVGILAAAIIESAANANAMTPDKFEQMKTKDRVRYVTNLVVGTVDLLKAEGRNDDADKVSEIFTSDKADEFYKNLDAAEKLNVNRTEDNKLQVEHVFLLTLKQNGISGLPQSVMTINEDFKPQDPPERKK